MKQITVTFEPVEVVTLALMMAKLRHHDFGPAGTRVRRKLEAAETQVQQNRTNESKFKPTRTP